MGVALATGVGVSLGKGCTIPAPAAWPDAGVPLAAGAGTADAPVRAGVGRAAGCDAGSPKPGGRIDSGRSCPMAEVNAGTAAIAIAVSAAPRASRRTRVLAEVGKRHGLLDMGLRPFGGPTGEQEQATDDHHENDDDGKDEAGHTVPCNT